MGGSPSKHDAYAALRHPNYRAFAGGFACSSMGLQMLATGLGWEIYERTYDPNDPGKGALALGLAGLARALPVVLFALPAGHASDVFNRKWIIVISQAFFAIAAAALSLWSHQHGPLWLVYFLLVLMGCVRALNGPARGAILPLIVPKADFQNAATWNTVVFHTSGIAGPLIAGVLIAWQHTAWPVYAACAVGTAVMAFTGTRLQLLEKQQPAGKFTISSMLSGLSYLRKERVVFGAILIDCIGVLLGGATALLPIFAKDILHVGPHGLGALKAASFVGAVIMALYLAHRRPFERTGPVFLGSVAGWALAIIAFGLSQNFYLSLFLLALQGAIDNISVVIRHVLVQFRTPDALRGRVSAVNSMFIEISNELGAFESGVVARLTSPVFSVVSGGIGTLIILAIIAFKIPELQRLGRIGDDPKPAT